MKLRDFVPAVLVVAVVALCFASLIDRWASSDAQVKALQGEVAEIRARVSEQTALLKDMEAAQLASEIKAQEANAKLVAALEKIKPGGQVQQEAEAMPMPEAVETTRRIIGDTGVTQQEEVVVFTPVAFRANLGILMSHEVLWSALAQSRQESVHYFDALGSANLRIDALEGISLGLEEIIVRKDAIIQLKDRAFIKKAVTIGGVAFVAGLVIGFVGGK